MKEDAGFRLVIKMLIKTLNQMGVTLLNIDAEDDVPVFVVELDGRRLIQSVERTLAESYGLLWTLMYGKVTDENRNLKIDLRYQVVSEKESVT